MIRGDMTIKEFVMALWDNKIKVVLLISALAFGPGLYDDWQEKRTAEKLEADRASVFSDASVTGMMMWNAWRSCRDIGILNDLEACSKYDGKLIQEQVAPVYAKMAVEHRDAYFQKCLRFHQQEYCGLLLQRSFALSNAQSESKE